MEQSAAVDLHHLHTFYWVARSGSFSLAGRRLALPKSTVSRQIGSLEARLGTRLIERTTRRFALTEIGQLYFAHCERVIAEAEDAERAVTAYTAEPVACCVSARRSPSPALFSLPFSQPSAPSIPA